MGPDHGVADLVILPQNGRHKLVIVEAKQVSSADAKIKVVGQLLMYYAGALEFGFQGVRLLQRYALEHLGPLFEKDGDSAPTTSASSLPWTQNQG
jgi:hypothetical protein